MIDKQFENYLTLLDLQLYVTENLVQNDVETIQDIESSTKD